MVDNVGYTPGTGALVAADDISGVLFQRIKTTFGVDGVATDVSASDPLPVSAASLPLPAGAATETTLAALSAKFSALGQTTMAASVPVTIASNQSDVPVAVTDLTASGNITTQNLVPAGAATAGSAVAITPAGRAGLTIQVTGTYTGALSLQGTVDGTTWVTIGGVALLNMGTGVSSATIASAATGIFQAEVSGFAQVRVTALAAVTGTAVLSIRAAAAPTSVTIGAPIPTGANNIGIVVLSGPSSLYVDVASAAITSTTTSSVNIPVAGCNYEINVPVTAVSGTSPTLDVVIQESDDLGTNWFDVYHFPRITAPGMNRSPKMAYTGNRLRYVQTVGGTTPSFTRAINRVTYSDTSRPYRRIFDRSLNSAQALGAVTATMVVVASVSNLQLTIAAGAITTTAPAIQLQGSEDGGVTWYNLGSPLTAVASSTVQVTVADVNAELVRGIVTTAGVLATLTSVALKAFAA